MIANIGSHEVVESSVINVKSHREVRGDGNGDFRVSVIVMFCKLTLDKRMLEDHSAAV